MHKKSYPKWVSRMMHWLKGYKMPYFSIFMVKIVNQLSSISANLLLKVVKLVRMSFIGYHLFLSLSNKGSFHLSLKFTTKFRGKLGKHGDMLP